jgi:hypothetical protein
VNPVPFPISICPFAGVDVKPVPPLATGNVPITPVDNGNPVVLVNVPLVGVPKTGATSVLLVSVSVVAFPTRVSVAAGSVRVVVPATAVACNVVVPDVDPDRSIAFGLSVTVVAIIVPVKVSHSIRYL